MTRVSVVYDAAALGAESGPDIVVGQVVESLRRSGHEASPLGLPRAIPDIVDAIRDAAPEAVFNLAESCAGHNYFDIHVAALLELLGLPFTGSDPAGLLLAQDKVLSKKLFSFDALPFPRFAAFYDEALEFKGDLRFPLLVKPTRLDASIGIDAKSVVRKSLDLLEKVRQVRMEFGDALVEEFIDGREISVAVIGNDSPTALPPIEVEFNGGFPKRRPRILDAKAKFDTSSAEYRGTKAVVATLDEGFRTELQRIAVTAYRALRIRDYGRVDFRLDKQARPYILEANPNPYLEKDAELALAAKTAGLDYDALVSQIFAGAMDRFRRRPGAAVKAQSSSEEREPAEARSNSKESAS
ncbi:MAG TPA: D-alanine--D-alanine ligase [Planctomycetota bacterium]|nr:D-alanine--D-alanine ligase [Planctomycetota bacterium]